MEILAASVGMSTNKISRFSIVQAKNMNDARTLFETLPHLSLDPASWIELHESTGMG